MANKKKHIISEERFCIEKMLGQAKSLGEIAKTLGRGKSTISEEVSSNGGREKYNAERADTRAYFKQYRKKKNCNGVAMDTFLHHFVEKCLLLLWSPERISWRLKELRKHFHQVPYVSGKSIRKFIKKRPSLERFLYSHRVRGKSGPKEKTIVWQGNRRFIESRPAFVGLGHWEGDFITCRQSTAVLLVLVEYKSMTTLIKWLPNRGNELVNQTMAEALAPYEVKTLTLDNDIAFQKWEELEKKIGAKIYFAHPYTSTDKPLVENTNLWIRQFVPKKRDIASVSLEEVRTIEEWFNNVPRQCLKGKTAEEVYMKASGYGTMIAIDSLTAAFVFGG